LQRISHMAITLANVTQSNTAKKLQPYIRKALLMESLM